MGQLEDMALFVRIAEAGAIGKAAEQLNMAKSAVSQRLKELEGRLGVQLISRTTRSLKLTDAGERYYTKAVSIVGEVSALHAEVANEHDALSGAIKVTVPHTLGLLYLTDVFHEFCQMHPDVRLQVDFSDSQVDLVEQGFDLALRIADLQDSSLYAKQIVAMQHILCASPDYLATRGTPTTIDALREHDFLEYEYRHQNRLVFIDPQGRRQAVMAQTKYRANNGPFLNELAIRGEGITCLPSFIVYDAIQSGKLVTLLEDHDFAKVYLYAVYPSARFLTKRCRALIEFVAEKLGDAPCW